MVFRRQVVHGRTSVRHLCPIHPQGSPGPSVPLFKIVGALARGQGTDESKARVSQLMGEHFFVSQFQNESSSKLSLICMKMNL